MSKMPIHKESKYNVKYLSGSILYSEPSDGILSITDQVLGFNCKRFQFSVSLEKIVDVATSETDDVTKAVGTYVALGMIGLAATRNMNKNRVMKVVYKDESGYLRALEFKFLPNTVKEVGFMEEARVKLAALIKNINSNASTEQLPTITCKFCGAQNNSNALFCKKCGQKTVEEKENITGFFCRYCGAKNENDAAFCESCGKKIGSEATVDKPVMAEVICQACKTQNKYTAFYCKKCGSSIAK